MAFDLGQPVRVIASGEIGTVFQRLELGGPNERYVIRVWRDGVPHDFEVTPGELGVA